MKKFSPASPPLSWGIWILDEMNYQSIHPSLSPSFQNVNEVCHTTRGAAARDHEGGMKTNLMNNHPERGWWRFRVLKKYHPRAPNQTKPSPTCSQPNQTSSHCMTAGNTNLCLLSLFFSLVSVYKCINEYARALTSPLLHLDFHNRRRPALVRHRGVLGKARRGVGRKSEGEETKFYTRNDMDVSGLTCIVK